MFLIYIAYNNFLFLYLFFLLLIITISLYSTIYFLPYKIKNANKIEISSLIACLITISAVYFFSSSSSDWLKNAFSVICITFNVFFLIFTVVLTVLDVMEAFKMKKKGQTKNQNKMTFKKNDFTVKKKSMNI